MRQRHLEAGIHITMTTEGLRHIWSPGKLYFFLFLKAFLTFFCLLKFFGLGDGYHHHLTPNYDNRRLRTHQSCLEAQ